MDIPSWNTTPEEHALIVKIADRFEKVQRQIKAPTRKGDRLRMIMDLSACHANGTALDFAKLLELPYMDFVQDVVCITSHMDRKTGKLLPGYAPMSAK